MFKDFEKGKISTNQFIGELQSHAKGVAKEQIVDAWNAMLVNFPAGRIEFLQGLQKKYRTFLLSNTNAIHHDAFQSILGDTGLLDSCFEKAYYSHVVGMRKPDKEIYEWVLMENGLSAEETLFIDDTPENVKAAESAGIRGLYLSMITVEELLTNY